MADTEVKTKRHGVVGLVVGLAAVVAAGALSISSSRYFLVAFLLGVSGVCVMAITIGAPLRRTGSPRGRHWMMIGIGIALFVVAGAASTFPPHSALLAVLILLVGLAYFTFGVAILGGGVFGFLGAVASGLIAPALTMAPTPIALAHVGITQTCSVHGYRGHKIYDDFSADCPDGKSYAFQTQGSHDFPGGKVGVITDRHNLLQAQYVGQHHPGRDLIFGILSLLAGAAIVAAAACNNRRLRDQVKHVIKPMTQT